MTVDSESIPNAFRIAQAKKDQGVYVLKCGFCRNVLKLAEERRLQLIEVWHDTEVSSATIADQLKDWNAKTSSSVVNSHRAGARLKCNERIANGWDPAGEA